MGLEMDDKRGLGGMGQVLGDMGQDGMELAWDDMVLVWEVDGMELVLVRGMELVLGGKEQVWVRDRQVPLVCMPVLGGGKVSPRDSEEFPHR